jgi:tetratricopeptide (TPR) repeat protein
LISAVRGDLDWIVMKSLEKDRRRRYETANGLAMDVQRYLNNEPIVARPPSRVYRLQKLFRRNKITFTAIGVVAASLLVSSTVSTVLFLREREARQRAVAAEQQQTRLRQEAERLRKAAEDRRKLSEATAYFTRGRLEDADDLLDEIDTPKPSLEYAALYRAAGEWHIANGRWRKAAERFAALVQVNQPDDWDSGTLDCLRHAPLLIELGDTPEYERFRKATITHHAGTENPLAAERVLMASLLRPADEGLLRQLEPFGEAAGKSLEISSEKPEVDAAAWRALALALLEYRRGNFRQALDWGDRSLDYQHEVLARVASVQLVLAMSHLKLGQGDQAGDELSKSRSVIEATFARGLTAERKWDGYWFDWVIARILLTEATTLSSEAEAKPKPKRR